MSWKLCRDQDMTQVIDLEVPEHADNVRYFEMMKIVVRQDGFEDTRKLAEYSSGESHYLSNSGRVPVGK